MRVLVVVPTYCEQGTVGTLLRQLRAALPGADVLVVDDASTDATCQVVESVAAELGGVELLHRAARRGLGRAYVDGMHAAVAGGYDVVCQIDADLSHDPSALPMLLTVLRNGLDAGHSPGSNTGADVVIGSRYVAGGVVTGWPWWRRWLSRWGNRYAAAVLGLDVHDVTAGMRAIRVNSLATIGLGEFRATGHAFQIEMAYRAVRAGCSVEEVPTAFRNRAVGRSKMGVRAVVEAAALVTGWGLRDLFTVRRTAYQARRARR